MFELWVENEIYEALSWDLCGERHAPVAHYQRGGPDFRARKSFETARRRAPVSQIPDIG